MLWMCLNKQQHVMFDKIPSRAGESTNFLERRSEQQICILNHILDLPTAKKIWSFWFYGRFGRFVCFALFCGFVWLFAGFCVRFALICGRFVGCADLRVFAQKTGSITKTTRIFWSLEDPYSQGDVCPEVNPNASPASDWMSEEQTSSK